MTDQRSSTDAIREAEDSLVAEFNIRRVSSDLVLDLLGAYNLKLEIVGWTTDQGESTTKAKLFLGDKLVAEGANDDVRLAAIVACRKWLRISKARPNPLS